MLKDRRSQGCRRAPPSIVRAVERLRHDFDQLLRIELFARELGMSVSGLHHHFKAVTALMRFTLCTRHYILLFYG